MSDKIIENNQVTVIGSVASEFTYSHEVFGEGFYMVDILVKRLSNSSDRIPVMVSERLIDVTQDYKGRSIMVSGQFRSYNRHEEQKNRLVLSVFAREMEFIEEEPDGAKTNHILLEGYMCKTPVYRKTPLGRASCRKPPLREIRLYPLYLLGKKRTVRIELRCRRTCAYTGKDPKQRICKEIIRNRNRDKNGI